MGLNLEEVKGNGKINNLVGNYLFFFFEFNFFSGLSTGLIRSK